MENNYKTLLLFILLCVILLIILRSLNNELEYIDKSKLRIIKSNIDGKYYYVQKNKDDLQNASDLLGELNNRITKLLSYLKTNKNKFNTQEQYLINNLLQKYSYEMIAEAIDEKNYTSYIIDKKNIYLCLRQRDDDTFVDINTLMFVLLHELAHLSMDRIISESEHKTDKEFNISFNMLIDTSSKLNIYEKIEYYKHPTKYCGLMIK